MILSARIYALIILATYELEEHDSEARHRTRAGLIDALRKVAPDHGMVRGQSVCDWRARLAWAIDEPAEYMPRNLFVVPDSQLEFARSYVAGADPDGVAVLDLDLLSENAGLAARASGVEALGFEGIRGLGLLDGIRKLAAERDEAVDLARRNEHRFEANISAVAAQRDEAQAQLEAAREAMARADLDPTLTIAEAITALDEAVCDASRAESVALGTDRRDRDAEKDRVVQLSGDLVVRTAERDELAFKLAEVRRERDAALLSNSAARSALDAAGCGSGSLADGIRSLDSMLTREATRSSRMERERNAAIAERDTAKQTLLAERAANAQDIGTHFGPVESADLTDIRGMQEYMHGLAERERHLPVARRTIGTPRGLWLALMADERRAWCAKAKRVEIAEQFAADLATLRALPSDEWTPAEASKIATVIREVLAGREPSP